MRLFSRNLSSSLAALLLVAVCVFSNLSAVEQGISLICHQVLGVRDVPHLDHHAGASHEHHHPGQSEPHRHGDPAPVFVLNDLRHDLKLRSAISSVITGLPLAASLLLWSIFAGVLYCLYGIAGVQRMRRCPERISVPASGPRTTSRPNAPPAL